MKRDYKAYFIGGRFNGFHVRFLCGFVAFILGAVFMPSLKFSNMRSHPLDVIGYSFDFLVVILMFPVILWGTIWQKIAAILLAICPLFILLNAPWRDFIPWLN